MRLWPTRRSQADAPVDERPGQADLHIHTDYSDGLSSVLHILEWVAKHTSLDVIAITDHDTMEGAWLAQALAERYGYPFEVIPGEEISTRDGHLLALFIEKTIPPGLSIEESIARVHAQGGLCLLPHPFHSTGLMGTSERYVTEPERAYDLPLDGVETRNGSMIFATACNRLSRQFAHNLDKPAVGGSDAHVRQAIGSSQTLFAGRTAQELRHSIEAGTVQAVGGYWSPAALFVIGCKWTWQRREVQPLRKLASLWWRFGYSLDELEA